MKLITRKDKLILAELNPDCEYIMLVNPAITRMETIRGLLNSSKVHIQIVISHNIHDSIKFVEIPKNGQTA